MVPSRSQCHKAVSVAAVGVVDANDYCHTVLGRP
jgi:hypothetical protein